jgi:hypothetical protein
MTHLTAMTAATALRRAPFLPLANGLLPRHDSVFCSRDTNCLEKRRAGFHYSVIGRYATPLLASGYAGRKPLNDEVLASKSPKRQRQVLMHKAVIQGVSIPSGRLRFRTGGRKICADDCGFAARMQVYMMIADFRTMRIDENIPATHPSYATVAPILHLRMQYDPANRSATFNNGAADANGR